MDGIGIRRSFLEPRPISISYRKFQLRKEPSVRLETFLSSRVFLSPLCATIFLSNLVVLWTLSWSIGSFDLSPLIFRANFRCTQAWQTRNGSCVFPDTRSLVHFGLLFDPLLRPSSSALATLCYEPPCDGCETKTTAWICARASKLRE